MRPSGSDSPVDPRSVYPQLLARLKELVGQLPPDRREAFLEWTQEAALAEEPERSFTPPMDSVVIVPRATVRLQHTTPTEEHSLQDTAAPPPELERPQPAIRSSQLIAERYELLDKLGDGAHATVYRAKDNRQDGLVAIKLLKVEKLQKSTALVEVERQFRRAAQTQAPLTHANIVRVLDADVTEKGVPYIVMELVEGKRLSDVMHGKALPRQQTREVLKQICDAMQYGHDEGVYHGNLTPSNVMLVEKGGKTIVQVLDFGLAMLAEQSRVKLAHGGRMATPAYMAPEQFRGETPTPLSDIYAVGLMVFEMITGRRAFEADDRKTLERLHCDSPPPDPCELDRQLPKRAGALVVRALQKEPAQRVPSASDLSTAFDQAMASSAVSTPKRFIWWSAAAILLAAITIGGAVYLWQPTPATLPALVAQIQYNQDSRDVLRVQFDASGSTPEKAVASYEWDFGDGKTSSDEKPVHRYDRPAAYEVRLIVTDADGNKSKPAIQRIKLEMAADDPGNIAIQEYRAGQESLVQDKLEVARVHFQKGLDALGAQGSAGLRAQGTIGLARIAARLNEWSDVKTNLNQLSGLGIELGGIESAHVAALQLLAESAEQRTASGPDTRLLQLLGQFKEPGRRKSLEEWEQAQINGLGSRVVTQLFQQARTAPVANARELLVTARSLDSFAPGSQAALEQLEEELNLLALLGDAKESPNARQDASRTLTRMLAETKTHQRPLPELAQALADYVRSDRASDLNDVIAALQTASGLAESPSDKQRLSVLSTTLKVHQAFSDRNAAPKFKELLADCRQLIDLKQSDPLVLALAGESLIEQHGRIDQVPAADLQEAGRMLGGMSEPPAESAPLQAYRNYVQALVLACNDGIKGNVEKIIGYLDAGTDSKANGKVRWEWETPQRRSRRAELCDGVAAVLEPDKPADAIDWRLKAVHVEGSKADGGDAERNRDRWLVAMRLAKTHAPAEAEKLAQAVLEGNEYLMADPRNTDAMEIMAFAEAGRKNYAAALEYWDRLALLRPVNADDAKKENARLDQAIEWARDGDDKSRLAAYLDRQGQILWKWHRSIGGDDDPRKLAKARFLEAIELDGRVAYNVHLGELLAVADFEERDFKKAEECADRALAMNPDHAEALNLKGLVLHEKARSFRAGEPLRSMAKKAWDSYSKAIEGGGSELDVLQWRLNLSALMTLLGQNLDYTPESKPYFALVGKSDLMSARAEYARLARSHAEPAKNELTFPNRADAWLALGNAYEDEAKDDTSPLYATLFDLAVKQFRASGDQASPPNRRFRTMVGRAYWRWGNADQGRSDSQSAKAKWTLAEKELVDAIKVDETDTEAYYYLASVSRSQGNHEEAAMRCLQGLENGNPDSAYWPACLEFLREIERRTDRLNAAAVGRLREQAVRLQTHRTESVVAAGYLVEGSTFVIEAMQQSNLDARKAAYANAEKKFSAGLDKYPENVSMLLRRSRVRFELSNFEGALADANDAYRLARTPGQKKDALGERGNAYMGLNKYPELVADLEEYLAMGESPQLASVYAENLSVIYANRIPNSLPKAIEWMEKARNWTNEPTRKANLDEQLRRLKQSAAAKSK